MSIKTLFIKILSARAYYFISGTIFTLYAVKVLGLAVYGRLAFIAGLAYTFSFSFSLKFENSIFRDRRVSDKQIEKVLFLALRNVFMGVLILCITSIFIELDFDQLLVAIFLSFVTGLNVLFVQIINLKISSVTSTIPLILQGTAYILIGIPCISLFERSYLIILLVSNAIPLLYMLIMLGVRPRDNSEIVFTMNNLLQGFSKTAFVDLAPITLRYFALFEVIGVFQLMNKFIRIPLNQLLSSYHILVLNGSNGVILRTRGLGLILFAISALACYPLIFHSELIFFTFLPYGLLISLDVIFSYCYIEMVKFRLGYILFPRILLILFFFISHFFEELTTNFLNITVLIYSILVYFLVTKLRVYENPRNQ